MYSIIEVCLKGAPINLRAFLPAFSFSRPGSGILLFQFETLQLPFDAAIKMSNDQGTKPKLMAKKITQVNFKNCDLLVHLTDLLLPLF